MERLTKRIASHVYYTQGKYEDTLPVEMETNDIRSVLKKLAEYEDLEEQGLLLRLPCKVGDVLWCIDNKKVESFVVKEFRICTYKIYRIEIYFENASGFGLCLFNGTLDEGWYRTKKEAEQALERMEKENG